MDWLWLRKVICVFWWVWVVKFYKRFNVWWSLYIKSKVVIGLCDISWDVRKCLMVI